MAQHREIENKTYNERLFSPGIRGFFHNARFKWLQHSFKKFGITGGSLIEIGCNDGRSIKYIPFIPEKYTGYDADWEGGFDEAVENYKSNPGFSFIKSDNPSSFNAGGELYDYSLAMETLEHLPIAYLDEYLKKMAAATKQYGFYSVPNERGFVFLAKHIVKKIFRTSTEKYSAKEIWHATMGNMQKVERRDTSHKGFDYKALIKQLALYFDIVEVKGMPFSLLPASLNFTIGIIVKKK